MNTVTSPFACKSKELIYVVKCIKHNFSYVGHTREQLYLRFPKQSYDISSRPDNSELQKHFSEGHK